ncbi:MAG: antirestriction protein ArdA [Muribaculaceae bacterium]|jgi:antirestriction protein|nr:antirestriction protein ArdA [Muribaculaceae bacterium]
MKIKLQFGELTVTPSVEKRLEDLGFCPDSFASDIQDHKSDCDGNPSVYVGTYGKYNDGLLTGLWIDLTTFDDFEDFVNFCKAIHADEEDPELDAQDWECLPQGLDGDELFLSDKWDVLKEYLELCDRYDSDAVDAYVSCFDMDCLDRFEERYQGEYDSEEDFAEYLVNELYDLDRTMGNLSYYFDYEKYARDIFMCDYTMEDKYVFIND